MTRTAKTLLLAAALSARAAALFAGLPMAGGDNSVRRSVVSGGGKVSSGGGVSLLCALGEEAVSTFSGAGFRFDAGYMQLAAQPGSVIALTAVTKATGTLELAWTAPGLDGFLGGVPNGLYRLDYSSSVSHPFAPTSFVAEFST